jgi:hypothetical protein
MADTLDATLLTDHLRNTSIEPKLNIVVESGHPNGPDLVRLYNGIKSRFGGISNRAMAGLTFEAKADCLPLGAADLFAYSVYAVETGQKPIGQPKKPLKADKSFPGNLHRVPLIRSVLDSLYEQALMIPSGIPFAAPEG